MDYRRLRVRLSERKLPDVDGAVAEVLNYVYGRFYVLGNAMEHVLLMDDDVMGGPCIDVLVEQHYASMIPDRLRSGLLQSRLVDDEAFVLPEVA